MHDALRFWIDTALDANRQDHTPAIVSDSGDQRGPFRSARALAITLMAMNDAYEACGGATAPYHAQFAPPTSATHPVSAAAAAAYVALSLLYPKQSASQFFDSRLASYQTQFGMDRPSRAAGELVGRAYVAWREATDAAHLATGAYMPGMPYDHDRDPEEPTQGFAGVLWGQAPSFFPGMSLQGLAVPPGADVPQGPVPPMAKNDFIPGPFYEAELDEVRRLGARASSQRSAEQLEIGIFWGYDGPPKIGTPPRLYMQVAMEVLSQRPAALAEGDWLHVLSAIAVGMGDAGIQAWHYKWSPLHMLWRPVLGVRHTQGPTEVPWVPYGKPLTNSIGAVQGKSPDFPAYPSGHATFGATAFFILRRFLRDREGLNFADGDVDPIAFHFVSDEFDGNNLDPTTGHPRPRRNVHFGSLWEAIVKNSESRIWIGVHWRMDGISKRDPVTDDTEHGSPASPRDLGDYGGVKLGMRIAEFIATARGF